jgi:hypothetical protein
MQKIAVKVLALCLREDDPNIWTVQELSSGLIFQCLDDYSSKGAELVGSEQEVYLLLEACTLFADSEQEKNISVKGEIEEEPEDSSELLFRGVFTGISQLEEDDDLFEVESLFSFYTDAELNDYTMPVTLGQSVKGVGLPVIFFEDKSITTS